MTKVKVGLNGFGRIGRVFTRIAMDSDVFEIVAINTRKTPAEMMSYLLKYDSVHGIYNKNVSHTENELIIDGKSIALTQSDSPEGIGWSNFGVEIVIDATGAFRRTPELRKHLGGTVKKVLLTAPAKDGDTPALVLGVNEDKIDLKEVETLSNASCTTNCAAPVIKVLDENFGIENAFLSTVHAYTSSQSLLDDRNKDFTRSRAAALSSIPTTTGAAKAVGEVLPHLKGKIDGMALRIPVPTGSCVDLVLNLQKETSIEEINALMKKYSEGEMKGILGYEETPLVSSDYTGNSNSSIFDANYTNVINGKFVKVFAWYDNEWGYSSRLIDLVTKMARVIN